MNVTHSLRFGALWRLPLSAAGNARAFSLLEVMVVLVMISLLMAVAIPSINGITAAQLRENSSVLGGAVRDTFARTALLGRTTRIVIDLEQQAWWIEESEGVARVKGLRQEPDRDGKGTLEPKDRRLDGIDAETEDDKERAKVQLLSGPAFQPAEGSDGQPHRLPCEHSTRDGVCIKSVWIEHLEEKITAGQTALYFFPGGFTEEAHITLSDDAEGERTLTLVVQPLTGEVFTEDEEPRIVEPEEDDE